MWCWKSSPLTSLHQVLGLLHRYHCIPREQIRVFLTTSPKLMEEMLNQMNQGLMTVDKKHIVSYTIISSFERNDRYGQASSKTVSRRSSSP
jgi:hypothetical protein